MLNADLAIAQTKKWILEVVVGCNFCPFAAAAILKNKIHYAVVDSDDTETILEELVNQCVFLDENDTVETSLLLLPNHLQDFEAYLELVDIAESVLEAAGYEGEYQIASFHPSYRFAESSERDAANYTNRSPYPMIHLLREASIEQAVATYPNVENVPTRNIAFATEKGLAFMQQLRQSCFK